MAPKRSGLGALAGATEAGIGYARQRSDTPEVRRRQPIDRAPAVALREFRALERGALRGFATIELSFGLILHDVPIFSGRKGPWASLPAKPVLDQAGRQRSNANGKPQYLPIAEWRDWRIAEAFSAAVIDLVRKAHPDALEAAP